MTAAVTTETDTTKRAASTGAGGAGGAAGAGDTDLRATLRRMQAAQRARKAPTYEQRLGHLERLEETLLKRKDAIADAISRDYGNRSRHESFVAEIFITLQAIRHTKSHVRDWMEPEERQVGWAFIPASAETHYQPLGVVGIIAPWNYPIQLALAPLVGALSAGNRAMIKPSELVPTTAELLKDIIAETFDPDHVTVVTGGAEVGEAFAKLAFDHLVFTGSTRVGRAVMRAAAENLTPVTLELGGKSPTIVGEDFAPDVAASRIVQDVNVFPDGAKRPGGPSEPSDEGDHHDQAADPHVKECPVFFSGGPLRRRGVQSDDRQGRKPRRERVVFSFLTGAVIWRRWGWGHGVIE